MSRRPNDSSDTPPARPLALALASEDLDATDATARADSGSSVFSARAELETRVRAWAEALAPRLSRAGIDVELSAVRHGAGPVRATFLRDEGERARLVEA